MYLKLKFNTSRPPVSIRSMERQKKETMSLLRCEQFRRADDEIKDKDVSDDVPEALGIHRKTFDIGDILLGHAHNAHQILHTMDENLKYRILCHHEVPDAKFKFPTRYLRGANRRCNKACLDDHMVYSKKSDSLWCLPCAWSNRSKWKGLKEYIIATCTFFGNAIQGYGYT